MTTNTNVPEPCADCNGLRLGTSSFDRPHDYLVVINQSEAAGTRTFRCLICRTQLTAEREGSRNHWK